jgi:acetyl-CoA C-acetyltransferase
MSSYILSAARTPIGKFLGSLSGQAAPQLGAIAVEAALRRAGREGTEVDEVILGNVLQAGVGQAPARQAALLAGLPPSVAAVTVNKVCGSGLKAVMLADQAIRCGDAQVVVAGGMESMSRAPYLLAGPRSGFKFGHQQLLDALIHDGLWCATEKVIMGALAEGTAREFGVTRDEQDAWALDSHRRAAEATRSGKFQAEIEPVERPDRQGSTRVTRDEGPREDATAESLANLAPSFAERGTITPGNASQLSDGAAAVVVVSESIAAASKTPWIARIVATAVSGVAPKDLFIAPVSAVQRVLAKASMSLNDIDLIELNEAFAAQCVACVRQLRLATDRVNVRGGAIALGHPIGASGARVLVTLLHTLVDRGLPRGLAALCLGGGNAVAVIVEIQHRSP